MSVGITCLKSLLDRRIRQIIVDLDVLILGDLVSLVRIAVEACEVFGLTAGFELGLFVLVTDDDLARPDGGAHFLTGIVFSIRTFRRYIGL
jgi:hypothetical protein